MNKGKNQNSILVLATLGVYLGLVLAGATPQVLAQAAMTRQFDVKDEIEVKDNLDKKPDLPTQDTIVEIDQKVKRSLIKFLAEFQSIDARCSPVQPLASSVFESKLNPTSGYNRLVTRVVLSHIISPTNLPRAGLDTLLASDAM